MNTGTWKTTLFSGLLVSAALPLTAIGETTDSLETEFIRGGEITIKLSAGEHRIVRSEDRTIRVHWTVGDERDDVDASTTVENNTAEIEIDGPGQNFETVIEVPDSSDLKVKLTAGVLNIQDIGGNREINLRAGELRIEVDDTNNYGSVSGSLWAGDIDAGPFQQETSGLFRSIDWSGEGKHSLKFKLMAGDV
ncbi:MAG: hypothetical protein AAGH19_12570, partial [Pseudomonadota bacterium]